MAVDYFITQCFESEINSTLQSLTVYPQTSQPDFFLIFWVKD